MLTFYLIVIMSATQTVMYIAPFLGIEMTLQVTFNGKFILFILSLR